MFNRLKERRNKNGEESGNTLVLYIMWFPLLMFIFGLAVDSSVATYMNSTLQSSLDAATQSALSRANNPGLDGNSSNKPELTSAKAQSYVNEIYDVNRKPKSNFIICQTNVIQPKNEKFANPKKITPTSGCAWTQGNFTLNKHNGQISIQTSIVEQSGTTFMHVLGVDKFTYVIKSEARVTYKVG